MRDTTISRAQPEVRNEDDIPHKVRALAHSLERNHAERRRVEYPGNGTVLAIALVLMSVSLLGWLMDASDTARAEFWVFAVASGVAGHFHARYRNAIAEARTLEAALRAMGWHYCVHTGTFRQTRDQAEAGTATPSRATG